MDVLSTLVDKQISCNCVFAIIMNVVNDIARRLFIELHFCESQQIKFIHENS